MRDFFINIDNLTFHNVREVIKRNEDNSYDLFRLPKITNNFVTEQWQNMNNSTTGVEIRFYLLDDEVNLYLKGNNDNEIAYIYFGNVQGEWFQSSFIIPKEIETEIKIKKPNNLNILRKLNSKKGSVYPFDLVRIVFSGKSIRYVRKKGETKPFNNNCKILLAYGSSISANSIVFNPELSYLSKLANYLGHDLVNLGYPGSCALEKEVVDQLCLESFDSCHLELGINVVGEMEIEEFSNRVSYLFNKLLKSHPNATYYVTDIFEYFNDEHMTSKIKVNAFRDVIKDLCSKYNSKFKVIYHRGNKLLKNHTNLCLDLVHPDIDGHNEIFLSYKKMIK